MKIPIAKENICVSIQKKKRLEIERNQRWIFTLKRHTEI